MEENKAEEGGRRASWEGSNRVSRVVRRREGGKGPCG